MKTTLKVIASIFALGAVVLFGLHLFLQFGLTKTMREVVLPRLKAETGIDARVGGLSLNVASGILNLKDVAVRNPDGFLLENMASIGLIHVAVDIPALLKREPLLVKSIDVENAIVNIIRNKDGDLNINKIQEGLPQPPQPPPGREPVPEVGKPAPEKVPVPGKPAPPEPVPPPEPRPIPEMLIEALQCNATLRYVDFKLNQLDIALDLSLIGSNISTLQAADTPWGDIALIGALGNNRTSFVTDIRMKLAPVTDPQAPSFNLSGKILEIDPRIMDDLYDKVGIRSAPFGFEPRFNCRKGWFENSSISLSLNDIVLEDKLARHLGGVGSIGTLRFDVPVEGPLQEPEIDVLSALFGAVGGNASSLFNSILKGMAGKEPGTNQPPATVSEAAVEVLGDKVGEIGESETIKKVLKDLADGKPSATNEPPPASSDVLVDLLGEQVKEIGEDEELKKELKNLGKFLFGK